MLYTLLTTPSVQKDLPCVKSLFSLASLRASVNTALGVDHAFQFFESPLVIHFVRNHIFFAADLTALAFATKLIQQLPRSLKYRLDRLVDSTVASILWRSRATIPVTKLIRQELISIGDYIRSDPRPFLSPIAHIVQREINVHTLGDASYDAAGAYSPTLGLWFELVWTEVFPPELLGKNLPHINALEFVAVIVQFAAVVTFWSTSSPVTLQKCFPNGIPPQPLIQSLCDNTSSESWAKKGLGTESVINLLKLWASLRSTYLDFQHGSEHISTTDNVVADDISRPDLSLTPFLRHQNLFQKHPFLKTYRRFQPSPTLLHVLCSALSKPPSAALPELPRNLGQH